MYSIRLFIFSVFLCLYSNVNAQWRPTANLTVFSEDGAKFYLILNGERYNDVPQTNIRIEELPNPYYNCKIIFEDKSLPELSKSRLMLADVDGVLQDVTYRIKKDNKGRNVLRFFSFVPAQQNMPRPANVSIYRFGQPNKMIGKAGVIQNPAIHMRNGAEMRNSNYTRKNNNYNTHSGCQVVMNNANFEAAKQTIADAKFEATKLSSAKQIISANCLNTDQLLTILSFFSFESSKLDFAKEAYIHCADRNNYFKVSNAFSFESSKTELVDYINNLK